MNTKFFFSMITLFALLLTSACATTASAPRRAPTVEQIDREQTAPTVDEKKLIVPDDGAPVIVTMTNSERQTRVALLTGSPDHVLVQPEDGFEQCTEDNTRCNDQGQCWCYAIPAKPTNVGKSGEIATNSYPTVE